MDAGQPGIVEFGAPQVIADLDQEAWAHLRSLVERIETHWPADGSNFRVQWNREDAPDPIVDEIVTFLHDHQLIGPDGLEGKWVVDQLNLMGMRNLALRLGPTEVLGMIANTIGVGRPSERATRDALESGMLPPLLERLLDFQPVGEQ
ncbi:hypothetical protein [Prescottella defluvii]|uniref:hypothetical protein n=1 Tax=Prescottella defluvii TaxID=1323361 RepID=UPI0004F2CE3C|nr:hypothetical protein [Prescottella defluvii]